MPESGAAPERIPVSSSAGGRGGYEILIRSGLRHQLPELLAEHCPAHRYAVISDDTVAPLYGEPALDALSAAGVQADLFLFRAGELHKTRESWARITDAMLTAGIGRDGAVIALGGGVVGDLAGFVAATYMRALPWALLPTSLLAMIDSSIGGKTGVDVPAGKNLVGAFHPPSLVVTDPEVLRTLPPRELRAGLAEAVKHGAIADADYLEWIAGSAEALLSLDSRALRHLVRRSVEIKASVVARDEREAGPRKALNFGHTLGHALEAASHYRLLHGEAVAIGMLLEARIGEAMGLTAAGTAGALRRVLLSVGLPAEMPDDIAAAEVLARTRSDKKARGGKAEYVLLERLGAVGVGEGERWGRAVPEEVVREVLESG